MPRLLRDRARGGAGCRRSASRCAGRPRATPAARLAPTALIGSAIGNHARGAAIDRDGDRGGAVLTRALGGAVEIAACRCSTRASGRRIAERDFLPSTVPVAPLPDGEAKSPASLKASPRSCAALRIAGASGCSLPRSTLAARRSTSFSSTPAAGTTATTFGLPSVSVPVLSITSVSMLSSAPAPARRGSGCRHCAPRPMPTMIDIGVASPSAQGQAMISTRHRGDQAVGEARLRPEHRPRRERQHRRGDHRRHEPAGDLVGEALDRRAASAAPAPPCRRCAPAWCRGRPFPRARPARRFD